MILTFNIHIGSCNINQVVSEEQMFENVDNIHTYEWTTEAYLYYKLTNEPKGSGELKKKFEMPKFAKGHNSGKYLTEFVQS